MGVYRVHWGFMKQEINNVKLQRVGAQPPARKRFAINKLIAVLLWVAVLHACFLEADIIMLLLTYQRRSRDIVQGINYLINNYFYQLTKR